MGRESWKSLTKQNQQFPFIKKKKWNKGNRKIMKNEDKKKRDSIGKKKIWEKGGDQKRTTLEVFFLV